MIGVGFLMGDALATVATQFPDTNFAIIDFPWAAHEGQARRTSRGLVFTEQEAGYLVGVAAATAAGGAVRSAPWEARRCRLSTRYLAGYRTAGARTPTPA